jgi:hypothetical protein
MTSYATSARRAARLSSAVALASPYFLVVLAPPPAVFLPSQVPLPTAPTCRCSGGLALSRRVLGYGRCRHLHCDASLRSLHAMPYTPAITSCSSCRATTRSPFPNQPRRRFQHRRDTPLLNACLLLVGMCDWPPRPCSGLVHVGHRVSNFRSNVVVLSLVLVADSATR